MFIIKKRKQTKQIPVIKTVTEVPVEETTPVRKTKTVKRVVEEIKNNEIEKE